MPISHTKINKSDFLNIISIGRCNWIKGYTNALDTMVILKNKKIKFYYTIIASGKDQENINYQINDLSLNNYVTFINGLSHENIINKLLESNIFLLPSINEGISNAMLEAMAIGVPVIATDCGGISEVIEDNRNGFLIPVRDSESMAEKIEYISYLEKSEIKTIINNATETLKNNYLLKDQVDSFKLFYNMIKNKNIMYKGANNVYR